jgi:hypothetical protein
MANFGITNCVELAWWETHQFNDKIQVVCLPVQQYPVYKEIFDIVYNLSWSTRGPGTRNTALVRLQF